MERLNKDGKMREEEKWTEDEMQNISEIRKNRKEKLVRIDYILRIRGPLPLFTTNYVWQIQLTTSKMLIATKFNGNKNHCQYSI